MTGKTNVVIIVSQDLNPNESSNLSSEISVVILVRLDILKN